MCVWLGDQARSHLTGDLRHCCPVQGMQRRRARKLSGVPPPNKKRRELKHVGIKVELDTRNEKINYKIREHSHAKVPVILVVGKREAEEQTVAVRRLGGKDQEILALKQAVATLANDCISPAHIS